MAIKLTARITDKDYGYDKLARTLEGLKRKSVKVGIQSGAGTELLQYANQNEFGAEIPVTPKVRAFFEGHGFPLKPATSRIVIPSRPFIRQTFDKRDAELSKLGFSLGRAIIQGKLTEDQALELWGDKYIAFIRSEVAEGNNFKPNAPLTIKIKGTGKHPLQDSGRLMQSLKSVIEEV